MVAIQYLVLALTAVILGASLSLLMRIHLAWPELPMPFWGTMKPEDYLALVTMHGTLMVFFVLITAPQSGFANLVLPEQIGSHRMALPVLNAVSFWLTALSLLLMVCAFFVPGGAPISGWTSYPPFSALPASGPGQALGMDVWLVSIGIFCIAAAVGAVSLLTTIVAERCEGMTLTRMPLTVWSWLVGAMVSMLVFSVLFAAASMLLCDRHLGTAFFVPMGDLVSGQIVGHGDGTPLLWLHLFWFFGHPVVYVAILPGMGITSSLLANFSRRRVLGYPLMAITTVLIGFLGLLVWGHHMFVSGMNPYAGTAFALMTMVIAVPSSAKVLSWIGTVWGGNLLLTTPMLFSVGIRLALHCRGRYGAAALAADPERLPAQYFLCCRPFSPHHGDGGSLFDLCGHLLLVPADLRGGTWARLGARRTSGLRLWRRIRRSCRCTLWGSRANRGIIRSLPGERPNWPRWYRCSDTLLFQRSCWYRRS